MRAVSLMELTLAQFVNFACLFTRSINTSYQPLPEHPHESSAWAWAVRSTTPSFYAGMLGLHKTRHDTTICLNTMM